MGCKINKLIIKRRNIYIYLGPEGRWEKRREGGKQVLKEESPTVRISAWDREELSSPALRRKTAFAFGMRTQQADRE